MRARLAVLGVLLALAVVATLHLTQARTGPESSRAGADTRECRCPSVVAKAVRGKKAFFPDIVRLSDGRLLVAYREGARHVGQDGRIMLTTSSDGGQTWSVPREAVNSLYDDRDPKLTMTRHGLVMTYFTIDWARSGPSTVRGAYVVRSHDLGASWERPAQISSRMTGAVEQVDSGYRLGWAASHSSVVELPDGDLLAPIYGTMPGDKWQRASVVRSTDGGRTWSARREITLAAATGLHFQEPTITRLSGGQLLAMIRSSDLHIYLSRSDDGGRTWSPATPTAIRAASHHLLPLADGRVLVTYGDLSGLYGPRRVTVGKIISRPGTEWNDPAGLLLYDSRTDDQANPSSVEVRRGKFLTLSYDTANGTIVGVVSYERDYLRRLSATAPPPDARSMRRPAR